MAASLTISSPVSSSVRLPLKEQLEYILDKTAWYRGQRPPVLSWLRGHIWPDTEQAGWERQHAPVCASGWRRMTQSSD